MRHSLLRLTILLAALAPLAAGCEELAVVFTCRTPVYVQGAPVVLPIDKVAAGPELLTNNGWRKAALFDELPAEFAVLTAARDRVQVLMRHHGVLDVYPGSLVVVRSPEAAGVTVLQGKCAFMPLPASLLERYRALSTEPARLAFIDEIKARYVAQSNGMLFIKNPLRIDTVFSSPAAGRGRSFAVCVDSNHELDPTGFRLDGLKPAFSLIRSREAGGAERFRYMAVTGLDIWETPGDLHFSATARDATGNWLKLRAFIPTAAFQYSVSIGAGVAPEIAPAEVNQRWLDRYKAEINEALKDPAFKRRYYADLELQNRQIGFYWKSVQVFRQSAEIIRCEKLFNEIFAKTTPEKLWQGKFIVPCAGVVTSGFGQYRWYYGGWSSVHRAIDIAAPTGHPVMAPNRGRIASAGHTPERGWNIVIDHGMGVYTHYFHLAELFVKTGELVGKGDVIASIGNTGLSSGPHLHWEMLVNGRRVNPMEWVKNAF